MSENKEETFLYKYAVESIVVLVGFAAAYFEGGYISETAIQISKDHFFAGDVVIWGVSIFASFVLCLYGYFVAAAMYFKQRGGESYFLRFSESVLSGVANQMENLTASIVKHIVGMLKAIPFYVAGLLIGYLAAGSEPKAYGATSLLVINTAVYLGLLRYQRIFSSSSWRNQSETGRWRVPLFIATFTLFMFLYLCFFQ